MMRKHQSLLVALALLATTAVPAQSTGQNSDDDAIDLSMSKEIAYYTFMEAKGRVEVYVSGQIAALEQAQEVVPFQIAVAVTGKGKELDISPLNFQFHDAAGNVYQPATLAEVSKTGLEQFVPQWVRENPLNLGDSQINNRRVASDFYPVTQSELTHAYLAEDTYLIDVVYFPHPEHLDGELMLSFFAEGMTDGAINVRFKVPQEKVKKHKDDKKKKK